MRTRSVLALAVPLLLLSACAPSEPDDVPEPTATPEPTASQEAQVDIDLPSDGLLGLRTTATGGTGGSIDITLIVHEAVPATEAPDAVAATEAWCAGEMDGTILADQGYSVVTVDITALSNGGEWPAGTTLHVYPEPRPGVTLTATGDLRQTPTGSDGDFTPHCVTPVSLDGPGNGTIIVGIAGDVDGDGDGTAPLAGFIHQTFGFTATSPDGTVADVTFADCVVTISDLGASYGAGSGADWTEHLAEPGACAAGGGMG